jgi:hypothetical protein
MSFRAKWVAPWPGDLKGKLLCPLSSIGENREITGQKALEPSNAEMLEMLDWRG